MTKKRSKEKEKIKRLCVTCGRNLVLGNFYTANSEMFEYSKMYICKRCVKERYEENGTEYLIALLRHINRPFMMEVLAKYNYDLGLYLKDLSSLPQYKNMNFKENDYTTRIVLSKKEERTIFSLNEHIEAEVERRITYFLNVNLVHLIEEKVEEKVEEILGGER